MFTSDEEVLRQQMNHRDDDVDMKNRSSNNNNIKDSRVRLKIAILGPQQAGKTLLSNIVAKKNITNSAYKPTAGVRILELEERFTALTRDQAHSGTVSCIVELWDVSGDGKYDFTWKPVMKDLDGAIFVFDPSSTEQSNDVMLFCKQIANYTKLTDAQCVLWANGNLTKTHNPYRVKSQDRTLLIPIENVRKDIVNDDNNEYSARRKFLELIGKCFAYHEDADMSIFL